ncbi:MAG: hypothetical protein K2X01_06740 [Cyanobacteria bacterium]|nr:hypothetical protein [Cyanobacteriota bacterium]
MPDMFTKLTKFAQFPLLEPNIKAKIFVLSIGTGLTLILPEILQTSWLFGLVLGIVYQISQDILLRRLSQSKLNPSWTPWMLILSFLRMVGGAYLIVWASHGDFMRSTIVICGFLGYNLAIGIAPAFFKRQANKQHPNTLLINKRSP